MAATVNGGLTTYSTASNTTSWASSTATTSGSYSVGYDPYITKQKRIMRDSLKRELKPGQLIMTRHFSIGLLVNFTEGGNPRCISYDIEKEELHRLVRDHWKGTKKAGDIMDPVAWTEYRCFILREAGDPKTVLPPGLVIQKSYMPF